MSERVDMICAVNGAVMSVPVELVEMYKAAGHRLAASPKPAQKKRPRRAAKKEE